MVIRATLKPVRLTQEFCNGERFRGILANRGQKTVIGKNGKPKVVGSVGESAEIQSKIKNEAWNDYHIVAQGNHFKHFINGTATIECTDEDDAARADGNPGSAVARWSADDRAIPQDHD